MSIAAIDLNLLLVLHTVLEERSVARAAERLHVTPPAVSNALARLRPVIGDPLVTRRGRGIVPTPRALELAPAIARGLRELETAIRDVPFDPASCTRTFTLAMADAGQVTWLPRIATRMARAMPRAQLRVVGIDSLVALGDLGSPEIDLHLGVRGTGAGLHVAPLFDERTVLVARRGHPVLGKRLSRSALGRLPHVRVDMLPGRSFRDPIAAAYARARIERVIALTVPSFTAAAAVAAATDLVTTIPESLLATHPGLRAVSGPVPAHAVEIALCWHDRTDADPAARAVREIVRAALV
ncbi:MAG TPA: LysR family transcriptional regulator [Kofleriaceae bacterium]|nr:LysR family transcriptional regulator [Kofleriaceae bacterium]